MNNNIIILGREYNLDTKYLDLSNHNLDTIPEGVYQLINLEILNLSNNMIHTIPFNILYLSKLK